ncbi:MAG: hypothetical protein R3E98_12795 [Gemmatimonadota bacterium]
MIERSTTDEIVDELRGLDESERRRVLEYARSLSVAPPKGTPGAALLKYGGAWESGVADDVAAAIEEACERVDPDAW